MKPDQNPHRTDFHGTGRQNSHCPQTGIIHGRDIGRPYGSSRCDKASKTLFRRNAQQGLFAGSRSGARMVRNVGRGTGNFHIALASRVPVDVIAVMMFRHYYDIATKTAAMPVTHVTFAVRGFSPSSEERWTSAGRKTLAIRWLTSHICLLRNSLASRPLWQGACPGSDWL